MEAANEARALTGKPAHLRTRLADTPNNLRRLSRAAALTAFRLRFSETLASAVALLPFPLLYGGLGLAAVKVLHPSSQVGMAIEGLGCLVAMVVPIGSAVVWFRRRPRHLGAWALDRHHGLHSRITSALAFAEEPEAQRTPLMRVAIEDALTTVRHISPRRAAPIRLPEGLPLVVVLLGGVALMAALEVQTVRVIPAPPAVDPLVMAADDLELYRELGRELERAPQDSEVLAAARRFNRLVEDIGQKRLDRREVFQRLEELERELSKSADAEKQALEDGLKNIARELERAALSKPLAEALAEPRLKDAEKALRELAEKMKRKQAPPNPAELAKLRKALERASRANAEQGKAMAEEHQRLQEEHRRLLEKQKQGDLSKQDSKKLENQKRQLERLDRQKKQNQAAQGKLSKLDQELAQAAADLAKDLPKGAQSLESAAEDVNQMAQQQLSDKQKQELLQRMRELRETLRQQGKGGEEHMQRMARFARKARGQQGQDSGPEQPGQPGRPGQGQKSGEQEMRLSLRNGGSRPQNSPGGKPEDTPGNSPGAQSGESPGSGTGSGKNPASGGDPAGAQGQPGKDWGSGHDAQLQGDPTALKGKTLDVSAAGADTGQGAASSEVIMGAAQRGFVGRGYRQVFTDYQTVAEQVMNQEQIPPGYRFYVRRYFQLIRPRE